MKLKPLRDSTVIKEKVLSCLGYFLLKTNLFPVVCIHWLNIYGTVSRQRMWICKGLLILICFVLSLNVSWSVEDINRE